MPTTPSTRAAENGPVSSVSAANLAAQMSQHLGTHNTQYIYDGTPTLTVTTGTQNIPLTTSSLSNFDLSQPFVMPGGQTTIGRVTIPMYSNNNGSDFLVSLYPDNGSGAPDETNLLSRTMVPASWTNTFNARFGLAAGTALATAKQSATYTQGGINSANWGGPAGGSGGVAQNPSVTTSGNYLIMAGGIVGTTFVPTVNTIQYTGGTSITTGLLQPALPQGTSGGALIATASALVYVAGGIQGSVINNVWTASWNPNTGQVGSWSAQTALPANVTNAAGAFSGNTVYVLGGQNSSGTPLNTVYIGQVTNGQLPSWSLSSPLPQAVIKPFVTVLNGWLIVAGGDTLGGTGSATTTVYYARILSDGSLSSWRTGPSLPQAAYGYSPGWDLVVTDNAMIVVGGFITTTTTSNKIQTLQVSSSGLADQWTIANWRENGLELMAAFPTSNGQWIMFNANIPNNAYYYTTLTPLTQVSVPLYTTGLTAGNTYHLVLQQKAAPAPNNDFVVFCQSDLLSSNVTSTLRSPRNTNTGWTAVNSGSALPIEIYSTSATGRVIHTWQDPTSTGSNYSSNAAAQTSTILYNYLGLPIGYADSSMAANDAMNANPTFTSGVSPWTATNGTITQSSAQVHGGFSFSGLFTPTGGFSSAFAESENIALNNGQVPIKQGDAWFMVNGWFYSPTGWSNFDLQVNWFDSTGAYVSTSFLGTTAFTANTWTNVVHLALAPNGMAFGGINAAMAGSPAATDILYMSNLTFTVSPENAEYVSSVNQITYNGNWPPSGVTQLA